MPETPANTVFVPDQPLEIPGHGWGTRTAASTLCRASVFGLAMPGDETQTDPHLRFWDSDHVAANAGGALLVR